MNKLMSGFLIKEAIQTRAVGDCLRSFAIASTLLVGCSTISPLTHQGTLVIRPKIGNGSYNAQTVVEPYTQSSIHHLILKLYTVDGVEYDQGIQQSLSNAQLDNPITFSNLKNNRTYRIKAYAYATNDDSTLISTTDGSSQVDVTLTDDDRPAISSLQVKLINRPFAGNASTSLTIINGSYTPVSSEEAQFIKWVSTLAGSGAIGTTDGQGISASFNSPTGVAVDSARNVYVADHSGFTIRKITPGGGVSTLAGTPGVSGATDANGTAARFSFPCGVGVDATGNVYVGDEANHTIRKISPTGTVTTLAGMPGTSGSTDGTGSTARFNRPYGLALDVAGNIYVSDTFNHTIRKVTQSGVVTTLAGLPGVTGTADGQGSTARFYNPHGIAVASSGVLYIADHGNSTVRKLDNGTVTTFAGTPGATGSIDGIGGKFDGPTGVAIDSNGNLFIANHSGHTIRKIDTNGVISTFAGAAGVSGAVDGATNSARFSAPYGIAIDNLGNFIIGDQNNNIVRIIR